MSDNLIGKFKLHLLSEQNIKKTQSFECGNEYPEKGCSDYLKKFAIYDMTNGCGVTYVFESTDSIGGFATLSSTALPIEDANGKCYCVNAIRIDEFAIHSELQDLMVDGIPVAAHMLRAIISKIDSISKSVIGAKVIILYSLKSAESFYEKNGFLDSKEFMKPFADPDDDCALMYLLIRETPLITDYYDVTKDEI